MVKRRNHAFHEFKQEESFVELPDMAQINQRLSNLKVSKKGTKLVDQIPDNVPSTLSIGGHNYEPIPEVPVERELAQMAIDSVGGAFRTFEDACPPPADTLYSVVDQGMSGPDAFRVSMYNIPASQKLRTESQLPLALLVRPFAEGEVPLADFSAFNGSEMPPRCRRCRAYMNPSMRFIEGGVKFICNLCLFVNVTPDEYYQPLTVEGKRVDWEDRPELAYGTYEFEVAPPLTDGGKGLGEGRLDSGDNPYPSNSLSNTDDNKNNIYGNSSPPMKHIFCCECTRDAVQKGVLQSFVNGVNEACKLLQPQEKVCVMLYSDKMYYFRKHGNTDNPQMLVMAMDDTAVVPPDVFQAPNSQFISNLLNAIPQIFADSNTQTHGFISAVSSALETVNMFGGGRVVSCLCTLPTLKPHPLTIRDTSIPGVTATDAPVNHQMFAAASKHVLELAAKAQSSGCGIDVLAVPTSGYIDISTISTLPQQSGGRLFYHPRFVYQRDNSAIVNNMMSLIETTSARSASLRIRCSTGLQVHLQNEYNNKIPSADTCELFMDGQTTLAAELKYDGNLDPKLDAHFQTAVLYTASDGSKRVRVLNLLAGVATKIKAVLKFVDIDVVLAVIVRQTLSQLDQHTTKDLRDAVRKKVMDIFGAARLHAGQGMPLSQLLMPTNLRQLAMMGLSLTKSIPLGVHAFSIDARAAAAVNLTTATPEQLSLMLYPRIHDIEKYAEFINERSEKGDDENKLAIALPVGFRARSTDLLLGSHAHLVFDGRQFFLWLGSAVSKTTLEQLLNVSHLDDVDPYMDRLPVIDTSLNIAARRLFNALALRTHRSWYPLQVVRERMDGAEYQVRQMLVEDQYGENPQYTNFVMKVHEYAKTYKEHSGWF